MAETDWTPDETAALDRVPRYNVQDWDAASNPYGFGEDGYKYNQMRQADDGGIIARGVQRIAIWIKGLADAVAGDRIQTGKDRTAAAGSATAAAGSAGTAKTDADRAAAAAAGVSLPGISAADALKFLQVKPDGSGYQTALVQKATSAQVTAGTDDAAFLTSLSGQMLKNFPRVARTANIQLVAADRAKLIDILLGNFSQTFAPAATLGAGWNALIENSGTNIITLDPNGAETIDGVGQITLLPGETRWVFCDGASFVSVLIAEPTGPDLIIQDRRAEGVVLPEFGAGGVAYQRELNTVAYTSGRVPYTLSANTLTIRASGVFEFEASGCAIRTQGHKLSLVTGSSTVVEYGSAEYSPQNEPYTTTVSTLRCVASVNSGQTFKLMHHIQGYSGRPGLPAGGGPEIYAFLKVRKVK